MFGPSPMQGKVIDVFSVLTMLQFLSKRHAAAVKLAKLTHE